jgi:hypothetical protein
MSWHSAGPLGQGRGLEAVRELVDGESVGDVGERAQHSEDAVGDASLVLDGLGADHRPLLGGRLVHAGEGGRHGVSLAHQAPQ